jgi:hypothetical protein
MDHETQIHSSTSDERKDDTMTTNARRLMTTTTLRRLLAPVRNRGRLGRRTVVSLALALVAAGGMTGGLAAAAGAAGNGNGGPGSPPTMVLSLGTQDSDPGPNVDPGTATGVINLDVHSINFGFDNPTSIGSAVAGAGEGKAGFHELQVSVPWDGSDVSVFKQLTTGGHFPWAVLSIRTPAQTPGGTTSYERYSFHFLFPAKLVDTSSGNETQLTFLYAGLEMRAYTITPAGGQSTPNIAAWNTISNNSDITTIP